MNWEPASYLGAVHTCLLSLWAQVDALYSTGLIGYGTQTEVDWISGMNLLISTKHCFHSPLVRFSNAGSCNSNATTGYYRRICRPVTHV